MARYPVQPMRIEAVTRYIVGGNQFASREAARAWVIDRIGETIDKQLSADGKVIGPGNLLAVVAAMQTQAGRLAELLAALADDGGEG